MAIDGKTIRGSKKSGSKSAIHLVSAFLIPSKDLLKAYTTEEVGSKSRKKNVYCD